MGGDDGMPANKNKLVDEKQYNLFMYTKYKF